MTLPTTDPQPGAWSLEPGASIEEEGRRVHDTHAGLQATGDEREKIGIDRGFLSTPYRVTPFQVRALSGLLGLSFREEGSEVSEDDLACALAELTLAVRSGISTVWRVDGGTSPVPVFSLPVGMIEVRYQETPPIGPHYLIGRLVVHPHHRDGKMARALIEAAILGIPEEDAVLLTSVLGPMRRSYRRYGAKEVGVIAAGTLSDVRRRLFRG
jgi:hypothetical protein